MKEHFQIQRSLSFNSSSASASSRSSSHFDDGSENYSSASSRSSAFDRSQASAEDSYYSNEKSYSRGSSYEEEEEEKSYSRGSSSYVDEEYEDELYEEDGDPYDEEEEIKEAEEEEILEEEEELMEFDNYDDNSLTEAEDDVSLEEVPPSPYVSEAKEEEEPIKWLERDGEMPEDLEGACLALIPLVYKDEEVDPEAMMRRTSLPDLYKYLKQHVDYQIITSGDEILDSSNDEEETAQQVVKPSKTVESFLKRKLSIGATSSIISHDIKAVQEEIPAVIHEELKQVDGKDETSQVEEKYLSILEDIGDNDGGDDADISDADSSSEQDESDSGGSDEPHDTTVPPEEEELLPTEGVRQNQEDEDDDPFVELTPKEASSSSLTDPEKEEEEEDDGSVTGEDPSSEADESYSGGTGKLIPKKTTPPLEQIAMQNESKERIHQSGSSEEEGGSDSSEEKDGSEEGGSEEGESHLSRTEESQKQASGSTKSSVRDGSSARSTASRSRSSRLSSASRSFASSLRSGSRSRSSTSHSSDRLSERADQQSLNSSDAGSSESFKGSTGKEASDGSDEWLKEFQEEDLGAFSSVPWKSSSGDTQQTQADFNDMFAGANQVFGASQIETGNTTDDLFSPDSNKKYLFSTANENMDIFADVENVTDADFFPSLPTDDNFMDYNVFGDASPNGSEDMDDDFFSLNKNTDKLIKSKGNQTEKFESFSPGNDDDFFSMKRVEGDESFSANAVRGQQGETIAASVDQTRSESVSPMRSQSSHVKSQQASRSGRSLQHNVEKNASEKSRRSLMNPKTSKSTKPSPSLPSRSPKSIKKPNALAGLSSHSRPSRSPRQTKTSRPQSGQMENPKTSRKPVSVRESASRSPRKQDSFRSPSSRSKQSGSDRSSKLMASKGSGRSQNSRNRDSFRSLSSRSKRSGSNRSPGRTVSKSPDGSQSSRIKDSFRSQSSRSKRSESYGSSRRSASKNAQRSSHNRHSYSLQPKTPDSSARHHHSKSSRRPESSRSHERSASISHRSSYRLSISQSSRLSASQLMSESSKSSHQSASRSSSPSQLFAIDDASQDSSSSRRERGHKSLKKSRGDLQFTPTETTEMENHMEPFTALSVREDPVNTGATTFRGPLGMLAIGKSVSCLKEMTIPLSSKKEKIYSSIQHEGFMLAIKLAYYKLVEVRPRLKYLLSLAEWRHVNMLMFYARVFECELAAANIVLPSEFRIALPQTIQVFEPFAVVLASIGIVDDVELSAMYIPSTKTVVWNKDGTSNYRQHNANDVTEFLEWNQYDWHGSWEDVEAGREERKKEANENGVKIPQGSFSENYEKLLDWEHLAVEKWLGWDDRLWFCYEQATHMLQRVATFVDFPRKSSAGTYGWLLPCHDHSNKDEHLCSGSVICRMPKPSLKSEEWMIALLFNLSALQPDHTRTWYVRSQVATNTSTILDGFLNASINHDMHSVASISNMRNAQEVMLL